METKTPFLVWLSRKSTLMSLLIMTLGEPFFLQLSDL